MNIIYAPLSDFLAEEKIEFSAVLPFDALCITNETKLSRLDFTPRSAVILLMPYYDGDTPERNISLYAVPRDYHLYFRQLSERLQNRLQDCGFTVRGFADSSPIDERDAAVRAGLGVIGDNHLLINEKYGSYIFIGSFLSDADAHLLADREGSVNTENTEGCLHCGRCTRACPSPQNCLSAITQKKGELSPEEARLVASHELIWGCDTCQLCCPMNENAAHTPIKFFQSDKIYRLDYERLDNMSETEFQDRAFSWRGRAVLQRNLGIHKNSKNI